VKRVSTALWQEADGTMRPLDTEQLKRISSSLKHLIEMIEWDSGLMAELYKDNCITTLQKMSIEPLPVTSRTERLVQMMSCKSVGEFDKFLRCLIETGQHHVETLLRRNAGSL